MLKMKRLLFSPCTTLTHITNQLIAAKKRCWVVNFFCGFVSLLGTRCYIRSVFEKRSQKQSRWKNQDFFTLNSLDSVLEYRSAFLSTLFTEIGKRMQRRGVFLIPCTFIFHHLVNKWWGNNEVRHNFPYPVIILLDLFYCSILKRFSFYCEN